MNAVKLLLEGELRGGNMARVNTTNKAGRTALHLAVEQKDVDILHYLLSRRDIDIDPKDGKMNQTPLYLAVKGRHPQMVEMLVILSHSTFRNCEIQCRSLPTHSNS